MNWKIRAGLSVILTVTAVICAAGALTETEANVSQRAETAEESEGRVIQINSAERTGYCLREYSGYVAIYRADSAHPETVTGIEINNLTKVDRDLLAQGIRAETREELMALLEDLGS